ncbi:MAG: tRNA (N(6)-L-threonylcarbamoyladenosine(37)-C(2))-methylthiotransferase MtaB [Deltaproteobacteria bacterium]|nr:tRNA (N(6)-L-threonylcarbamoyladenosine(37)-C(2))-methylthiotransferase MtaB [Deltaproteobacteria bacterium]
MTRANPHQKVYIKTLGCKVNSFDSQVLEHRFRSQGYSISTNAADADIQVINSCSVTAAAERETRYLLRHFRRENPQGKRIVTGCYAQIDSAGLAKLEDVDFVIPNESKTDLVAILGDKLSASDPSKLPENTRPVEGNRQSQFKTGITLFDHALSDRTRAFLKVQDGCNGFCAYCQIPYARGASVSVPEKDVLEKVHHLLNEGVPEIVVTGIHVGDYGRDFENVEEEPFVTLIEKILAEGKLKRLRISSLEPSEVSVSLLRLLKKHEDRVCDHFHLPLQSGDNRILRLMRRTYTREEYLGKVNVIREFFPHAHISADVIVGFPQEGDEEFQETVSFINELRLGSLHVFPYSKRPNTLAQKLPGHVPVEAIKERAKVLRQLSGELYYRFSSQFVGERLSILWEQQRDKEGRLLGKSRNYLSICAPRGKKEPTPGTISLGRMKGFVDGKTLLAI